MDRTKVTEVTAELTAAVVEVVAGPGDVVSEGDPLVVVESMKMKIPIPAPATGKVRAISVEAGDVVAEGDVLALLDPAPS